MSRLKIKGDNGGLPPPPAGRPLWRNSPTGPSSCSFTSLWAPREVPGAFSFASRIWPGRCANRAARLEPISRSSRRGRSAGSGVAPTSMLPVSWRLPTSTGPTSAASRLTRSAPLDRLKPSMWRPSERCCWSVPASVADTRPRIAGWLPSGSSKASNSRMSASLFSWAADASTSPGSTDSRGSPSVPCITSVPFYRRSRAASFPPAIGLSIKCKCCDWKNAGSKQTPTATRKEEPAWENFSQAQPPKIKRNEMMLIPKWGNYPGN